MIRVIMRGAMQVTLELPEELADVFGPSPAGLSRAALEALTLEALRAGRFTEQKARQLLGIATRYEMDGFLKAHGLLLPLTAEDIERDAATALQYRAR
jgi:hypothetical protein